MASLLISSLLLLQHAFAAPLSPSTTASSTTAATVGKIRGVSSPIYHLYLQTQPSSASAPGLGPEATAEDFIINNPGTIQSKTSGLYVNIVNDATSYKSVVWGSNETAATKSWGLEGDTIITVTGSTYGRQLNFLACESTTANSAGRYDLYLQTGSDVPSGRSCSNYQTLHLPCLC